jgi:glycosyltransferase involved in cell wall biosynthesis
MSRVLLSAALIARNEEKFLGDCLASLQNVADEVVVVDTGSTDQTRAVAARGGARLYEFPWTGDFSAARNHALDRSTGEWILYIDADERVRAQSAVNLRAELSAPSHLGYRVLLHPLKGHTPYWSLRLFRNHPSIRFRGVIHESTWPALNEYRARHGGEVGQSHMILDHEGYEANQDAKHARNLPLLLEYLRHEPDRVYCWCHLANIYMEMKQPDLAENAWRSALAVVRSAGVRSPEDLLPYLGLVEIGLERGDDVDALYTEALSLFPSSVQLEWLRSRILMRKGELKPAIAVLERLVERGQSEDFDHLAAYDLRLFGVFAYDALATCHFRLGQYAESRRFYELAARHQPDRLDFRVKQALCTQLELGAAGLSASA